VSFSMSDMIPKAVEPAAELPSEDEAEVKSKKVRQIISDDEDVFEEVGGFDDYDDGVVSDGG